MYIRYHNYSAIVLVWISVFGTLNLVSSLTSWRKAIGRLLVLLPAFQQDFRYHNYSAIEIETWYPHNN